ncbi:hypothetical protein IQ06DRAFT_119509 [Phaeosphaeriaceae sp. SRC1lsM3a]|nr:hypothetical protein IQ06DRAFT_119509 [Stagonospora sp. SRC1lsM3a]
MFVYSNCFRIEVMSITVVASKHEKVSRLWHRSGEGTSPPAHLHESHVYVAVSSVNYPGQCLTSGYSKSQLLIACTVVFSHSIFCDNKADIQQNPITCPFLHADADPSTPPTLPFSPRSSNNTIQSNTTHTQPLPLLKHLQFRFAPHLGYGL